ncbi:MAG TPA: nuclear transport factor 2 family protein [Gaiellales bacterium]|jgi:ketosteroid isomerase-like protein|nr:nuclear transport factor 2 family protein [Gaiellales bacterium]
MTERVPQSNIEIVFSDWLDAMRRGDVETMAHRLAPDVVHEGIRPGMRCTSREQVLSMVRRRSEQLPTPEAIELVAAGDHVVMSVRGSGIGVPADEQSDEPRGEATVVFTLEAGMIVHMQDYLHRTDALEAVGAPAPWG